MDKDVIFTGRATHIGTANDGVDTQAAAVLAINAINAQREGLPRFYKPNRHLVHAAILSGAKAINIVEDHTQMTVNYRGMSIESLKDLDYRIGRAIKGAAIAMGAGADIQTVFGYMPYLTVKDASVIDEVFGIMDPEGKHPIVHYENTGCSDYGDLSQIMPVLQFFTGGHNGEPEHSTTFSVGDPYEYYIAPAKGFALLAYRLLKDNASLAKRIIADNPPKMSIADYFNMINKLSHKEVVLMEPAPYNDYLGL